MLCTGLRRLLSGVREGKLLAALLASACVEVLCSARWRNPEQMACGWRWPRRVGWNQGGWCFDLNAHLAAGTAKEALKVPLDPAAGLQCLPLGERSVS